MSGDANELLRLAKDRIACAVLGGDDDVEPSIGTLTLRPHQRTAVNRLLEIITRFRGALLADAVGLGKTYVALAIARKHARPLVIGPAALRAMWERAMAAAGVQIPILSIERLARGERPTFVPDLLIVDEAHHFRTPTTRRYEALADLAGHARLLLMSATPLHNSRRDLTALLGLFAGSGIGAWSEAAIGRLVVRRDEHAANELLPPIDGPHALSPGADDDCLSGILALPPSVPAADEGVAHALTTMSLVHLWASSRAALLASMRKRRARALALRDAIGSGHLPTSAELSAWQFADDALQLAFPFCVAPAGAVDIGDLEIHLDAFAQRAAQLIDQCRTAPDPDAARVHLLRMLRARHAGARVVAFSQYAQTVLALGRRLRADPRVAVVTADGGSIASGRIARAEVLRQFAGEPRTVPAAERIDLLLTTDLLSEGIDLRGAAVIVHLDLPWNPARLEQRVGRARRIGSPHAAIHVYTFVPPAAAERTLELQRRLTAKVRTANSMIGGIASPIEARRANESPAALTPRETLRARLSAWIDPAARPDGAAPIVAAAISRRDGWMAAVHVDGMARLIYSVDGTIGEDPETCAALASQLGEPVRCDPARDDEAVAQVQGWLMTRRAVVGIDGQSTPKRAVLERLAQTLARSPRHRKAAMIAAAHRARASLATVSGVGAERILTALARSTAPDDAWVQSLATFGSLNGNAASGAAIDEQRIVAVILLCAVSPADDATH